MYRRSLILLVVAGILLSLYWDWDRYLTLETLKASYHTLLALRADFPWLSALLFFMLYLGLTALSLPGLTLLKLTGGALFGLEIGTLLVSFANSIGATLALLLSRHLLRDLIHSRFPDPLDIINQGVAEGGIFYLLSIRLVPIFPSSVVNLLMGLTPMPARTFYWVSQIGMLPAALIYVQAGTQLARIQQLSDIVSFGLLSALLLFAGVPLLARQLLKPKIGGVTLPSPP